MAIKQGTVSTFPLPSPVKAQVANPTAGGNPLNLIDPNGNELQVVDFQGLRYSLRLMQDAINKLENPPASSVAATNVIANTQLEAAQSGSIFSNAGLGYAVTFTLPQAEIANPPISFVFYVSVAFMMKIQASGGAKISNSGTTSGANGYTESNVAGNGVTITCLSVNTWVCHPVTGTWTTV